MILFNPYDHESNSQITATDFLQAAPPIHLHFETSSPSPGLLLRTPTHTLFESLTSNANRRLPYRISQALFHTHRTSGPSPRSNDGNVSSTLSWPISRPPPPRRNTQRLGRGVTSAMPYTGRYFRLLGREGIGCMRIQSGRLWNGGGGLSGGFVRMRGRVPDPVEAAYDHGGSHYPGALLIAKAHQKHQASMSCTASLITGSPGRGA